MPLKLCANLKWTGLVYFFSSTDHNDEIPLSIPINVKMAAIKPIIECIVDIWGSDLLKRPMNSKLIPIIAIDDPNACIIFQEMKNHAFF